MLCKTECSVAVMFDREINKQNIHSICDETEINDQKYTNYVTTLFPNRKNIYMF